MIKRDEAGNVQWFKARLVSGETHQFEDIDYQTTYEPTSHCGDVRMVLVITAMYNIEIHQIVQCLALLGVDLEEEIHMHPLQGYFRVGDTGSQSNNPRLTDFAEDGTPLEKVSLWPGVLQIWKYLHFSY
jgi:hypothetical protein